MITFTRIPEQYSPLAEPALYAFECDTPQTVDLLLTDDTTDKPLGARRYVSVTRTDFDAAPLLRRAIRFVPTEGGTGIRSAAGRQVLASAKIFAHLAAATAAQTSANVPEPGPASTAQTPAPSGVPRSSDPTQDESPARTLPAVEQNSFAASVPAPSAAAVAASDSPESPHAAAVAASDTPESPHAKPHMLTSSVASLLSASDDPVSMAPDAFAPTRIFLPSTAAAPPALLTTMPRERAIAPGECDELTLLCDEACTITLTAQGADGATVREYTVPSAGLYLFRLDTRDFPQAETLHIDLARSGTVAYSLLPAPPGSVRLAWRSSAGSIEHYTFPGVRETVTTAERQQGYGPDGCVSAAAVQRRRQRLVSAFEMPPAAEALAELQATPQCWLVADGSYIPVVIAPGTLVVQRCGALCCLELELRPAREPRLPWN